MRIQTGSPGSPTLFRKSLFRVRETLVLGATLRFLGSLNALFREKCDILHVEIVAPLIENARFSDNGLRWPGWPGRGGLPALVGSAR